MSLLSPSELGALSAVVESGMTSDITILRLMSVDSATGQDQSWTMTSVVKGWMYSGAAPVLTIVSGAQALVDTFRLFVPLGTDVRTGDRVQVGGETYTVSDTTAESTWQAMLTVSLRKAD